jgi:hypothetical protein
MLAVGACHVMIAVNVAAIKVITQRVLYQFVWCSIFGAAKIGPFGLVDRGFGGVVPVLPNFTRPAILAASAFQPVPVPAIKRIDNP